MRWAAGVLALALACRGGDKVAVKVETVALTSGRLSELTDARRSLLATLEEDRTNGAVIAGIAEVDGLSALLYGIPVPEPRVFVAVAPGAPGARSWAIGNVARELTRVDKPEQLDELDKLLAGLGDDPWRTWLAARIKLARGDRVAAAVLLEGSALPAAKVDRALILADEDRSDDALASLAPDHELELVTRAVLLAERGELDSAALALKTLKSDAPRIVAYRLVAQALIGLANQRYELTADALEELGKQRGLPNECPLWERIAWAHLQLGRSTGRANDHKRAGITRQRCASLGRATGDNDRLRLVDATLQLELGKLDAALSIASNLGIRWGLVTRAYVLLELGRANEVVPLFVKIPSFDGRARPENRAAEIVLRQAQASVGTGTARSDALAALAALADASAADDQRARHALGAASFAIGDLTTAQRELRRVVEETSAQRPDPFAYRTHQLLAEIALVTNDFDTAGAEIDQALVIHPGNAMSYVIQARIAIRRGDPERALATMAPVRKLGELIPAAKLVVAEALAVLKSDRATARALVVEVKGKLPDAEVGRVAALVDPKLPGELKLPVGKLPKQGT